MLYYHQAFRGFPEDKILMVLVESKVVKLHCNLVLDLDNSIVGCFGFNGPLRQYFSLYRAVSQREGERGEKG